MFVCENRVLMEAIHIRLGTCAAVSAEARPCHWAWAERHHAAMWGSRWSRNEHNCAADHIADWPGGARAFGDGERTVRLVFAPCPHAPDRRTLVLGLELVGDAYARIQQDANVSLPQVPRSRARLVAGDALSEGSSPALQTGQLRRPTSASDALPASIHPTDAPQSVLYSDGTQPLDSYAPGKEYRHSLGRAADPPASKCGGIPAAGTSVLEGSSRANASDAIDNVSRELRATLKEHTDAHAREMQEVKQQVHQLSGALEHTHTELADLKGSFRTLSVLLTRLLESPAPHPALLPQKDD